MNDFDEQMMIDSGHCFCAYTQHWECCDGKCFDCIEEKEFIKCINERSDSDE